MNKTEVYNYPVKQFGVQIQFTGAQIMCASDKKRVDYSTAFHSDELPKSVKVYFESVNQPGFGLIAKNSICSN